MGEQKKDKLEAEIARTEQMKAYEKEYASFGHICGVDEVGRGPFAGPVVAAAVILPKDCSILYINDSKKLSPKKEKNFIHALWNRQFRLESAWRLPRESMKLIFCRQRMKQCEMLLKI